MVSILDYGADDTGTDPIDSALADALADSNTVEFPEGDYLVDGWLRISGDGWSLQGTNATLILPGGGVDLAGVGWVFEGFEIDYTDQSGFSSVLLGEPGDGGWTFGNIVFRGTRQIEPKNTMIAPSVAAGETGYMHDVYAHEGSADGDEDGKTKLMWHDSAMAGTLEIDRIWAEHWPENTIYGSDMDGDIIVRDSYFRNTNTGCIRYAEGITASGCVFAATGPIPGQWNEERKGATEFKGVWCNFNRGSGNGSLDMDNCDFYYTYSSGVGSGVEVDGPGDTVQIDNSNFHSTFDVDMIDGAGESVTFGGSGNCISGGFNANVGAIGTSSSSTACTDGTPPMPQPPPEGETPSGGGTTDPGDDDETTDPTNTFEIASVESSPAMWYEFSAEGEISGYGGTTESNTDIITQELDGDWSVEGVTGPTGADTYEIADTSLQNLGIFELNTNNSTDPADWDYTSTPVSSSDYALFWNGQTVTSEDIVDNRLDLISTSSQPLHYRVVAEGEITALAGTTEEPDSVSTEGSAWVAEGTIGTGTGPAWVDEFDDQSLSEYSGDTADFDFTTSTVFGGDAALRRTGSTGFSSIVSTTGLDNYPSQGDIIQGFARTNDLTNFNSIWLYFGYQDADNNYRVQVNLDNGGVFVHEEHGGTLTQLASDTSSLSAISGSWYRLEADWADNGDVTFTVEEYADSSNSATITATASQFTNTWTSGGFAVANQNNNANTAVVLDQVRLNPDTGGSDDPEDTYTIQASGVSELSLWELNTNNSDDPADWTYTTTDASTGDYELQWNDSVVTISELLTAQPITVTLDPEAIALAEPGIFTAIGAEPSPTPSTDYDWELEADGETIIVTAMEPDPYTVAIGETISLVCSFGAEGEYLKLLDYVDYAAQHTEVISRYDHSIAYIERLPASAPISSLLVQVRPGEGLADTTQGFWGLITGAEDLSHSRGASPRIEIELTVLGTTTDYISHDQVESDLKVN